MEKLCYNESATQLNTQFGNGVHFYYGKNVCSVFVYRFGLCENNCVAAMSHAFFGAWLRPRTFCFVRRLAYVNRERRIFRR